MKNILALCCVVVLLFTMGCGEYREYSHFDYKSAEVKMLKGKVEVDVYGTEALNEIDGQKYSVWGEPYKLMIVFRNEFDSKVEKLKAENIVIIGEKTGVRIRLDSQEDTYFYKRKKKMGSISLIFKVPVNQGLEYEDFIFSAMITVVDKSGTYTKEISVRMERYFWKEKRSIALDRIMSV